MTKMNKMKMKENKKYQAKIIKHVDKSAYLQGYKMAL